MTPTGTRMTISKKLVKAFPAFLFVETVFRDSRITVQSVVTYEEIKEPEHLSIFMPLPKSILPSPLSLHTKLFPSQQPERHYNDNTHVSPFDLQMSSSVSVEFGFFELLPVDDVGTFGKANGTSPQSGIC
jgi:hypothetical protein